MMRLVSHVLMMAAFAAAAPLFAQEATPQRVRSRTHLRGDLFLVQDGDQYSVLYDTPHGVLVGDPLNTSFARWLRDDMAKSQPGKVVRFVVHTHHDPVRAGGAGVFDSTAEIVAHEGFNREVEYLRRSGGGAADVLPAETEYRAQHTITLGDRTVELLHIASAHAPALTAVYFPAERVLFASRYPALGGASRGASASTPQEVMAWLERIEPLDFEVVAHGDGTTTPKQALLAIKPYVEELLSAVRRGIAANRSLATLQEQIALDAFAGATPYPERRRQIADAYRAYRVTGQSIYVAGQIAHVQRRSRCPFQTACVGAGGTSAGATVGLLASFGRWGAMVEGSAGAPMTGYVHGRGYVHDYKHRETPLSFMVRFSLLRNGPVNIGVGAGPAFLVAHSQRIIVRQDLSRSDQPLDRRFVELGINAGADVFVSPGSRFGVVGLFRVTSATASHELGVGEYSFRGGLGVVLALSRRVR